METMFSVHQMKIFNRLYEFSPKNFDEYNSGINEIIGQFADEYNIAKVCCRIVPSPNMPFSEKIPRSFTLFESGEKFSDAADYVFRYAFDDIGEISFSILFNAKRMLEEREKSMVDFFCRQLFNILNSLIFSFICRTFAVTDPGTGISNQEAFIRFGKNLINKGELGKYTALYFNIHNFKSVHKSLSYLEGNDVLARYCNIVANAITKREIVAHLGSDNFAALVLNANMDYFLDLIQNMVVNYEKDGKLLTFIFGATIGAARLEDIGSPSDIMMMISAAYQSAREKRVTLRYYDKNANLEIIERKIILSKFIPALNNREFFVVYQPKVDIKTKAVTGAEALVRWKNGDEFIMPGKFIPVLENDGCITALDFYVLEEVCRLQQKLAYDGIELVKISVNFSKRHLTNNRLVEEIVEVIDRYGVPHDAIEVELTESEDFHNHGVMQGIVDELNHLGIKTSIDDFGTGYSSLGMLKTLRIDELKIDRSFIPESEVQSEQRSILMLRGVVNLAKSLGLTIVAEGVETVEQLKIIEGMECDIVQGFIFDKPLPEVQFIERLKQRYYEIDSN